MTVTICHGDMLEILPTLPADSVDSCVTDPPYHLTSIVKRFGGDNAAPAQFGKDGAYARASRGFMGKQWDGGDVAFRPETWAEVLRVMKPGAYLLAFASTRGFCRMACVREGFNCILIEREAEYVADIRRRVKHISGADTPLFKVAP